jgi:hypothetical protein
MRILVLTGTFWSAVSGQFARLGSGFAGNLFGYNVEFVCARRIGGGGTLATSGSLPRHALARPAPLSDYDQNSRQCALQRLTPPQFRRNFMYVYSVIVLVLVCRVQLVSGVSGVAHVLRWLCILSVADAH